MTPEFACPACGAHFPNEIALREHGSKMHPMPAAPPAPAGFACQACGARFASQAELMKHGAENHRM